MIPLFHKGSILRAVAAMPLFCFTKHTYYSGKKENPVDMTEYMRQESHSFIKTLNLICWPWKWT